MSNEEEGLHDLKGIEKAAVLLISLGAEASALVFKSFDEDVVEKLTTEIMKMRDVHPIVSQVVFLLFQSILAVLRSLD